MRKPYCTPPGSASRDRASLEAAAGRCLSASACTYCEVCQLMCPDLAITRNPETGAIEIDLDFCKGCGLCSHFCPKHAITMEIET